MEVEAPDPIKVQNSEIGSIEHFQWRDFTVDDFGEDEVIKDLFNDSSAIQEIIDKDTAMFEPPKRKRQDANRNADTKTPALLPSQPQMYQGSYQEMMMNETYNFQPMDSSNNSLNQHQTIPPQVHVISPNPIFQGSQTQDYQRNLEKQPQIVQQNTIASIRNRGPSTSNSFPSSSKSKPVNKRRLRWTPELHNRFVDVVNFLGGPESKNYSPSVSMFVRMPSLDVKTLLTVLNVIN